jgi:xanthine dehydrogenase YagS FAD-binding subunit
MNPFAYKRAADNAGAIREAAANHQAKFLAGGTNLLDLMKMAVQTPNELVDINRLPLKQVEKTATGIRIGALVSNSDLANHPLVRSEFPVLSQALLAGASPQLRNMATVGGNLMQRTRCYYFMDPAFPCNKRQPGSGCSAIPGFNRIHAILGASDKCIAVHPSDMCVGLAALEAVINVEGPHGSRQIPMSEFHRLPGDMPQTDTNLMPEELIVSVDVPRSAQARQSGYLKVRDRAQYAFALVSVAAALDVRGGKINAGRLALGGVAHKPWRSAEGEAVLTGGAANEQTFRAAADAALKNAVSQSHNAFKIELAKRAIVRCLLNVVAMKTGGAA